MKKLLITLLFVISSTACVYASSQDAKTIDSTQKSQTTKVRNVVGENVEDPDLKLSIEELRKKYPISLLDEKKKKYKAGQKINIDDYSIEEIKAAFLNADRNFMDAKPIKSEISSYDNAQFLINRKVFVFSDEELSIIETLCYELGHHFDSSKLTNRQKILQMFVFSNDKIISHIRPYISDKAKHCFSYNDPLDREDRN